MIIQIITQPFYIRDKEKRIIKELGGLNLLTTTTLMTFLSLVDTKLCFYLFSKNPNWYILGPILLLVWYIICNSDKNFKGGGLHWGLLIGTILFIINSNYHFIF
jgi:hypothetical protein